MRDAELACVCVCVGNASLNAAVIREFRHGRLIRIVMAIRIVVMTIRIGVLTIKIVVLALG